MPKLGGWLLNKNLRKRFPFGRIKVHHTTHFLEAFPFNSYYHLAKNDLTYDVFTDGFPPLYEQGKCGSKRLMVQDFTGCPSLSWISVHLPETRSPVLLSTFASALGVPQESLSRLTWQEIREDLVGKITFEFVIYWALTTCEAYRRHFAGVCPF